LSWPEWVLYWMQQSQRAHDNPALEYAIHRANPGPARAGGLRTDRQLPGGQPAPLPLHAGGTGRNPGAAGQAPHRMVVRKGDPARCSACNGCGNRRCWSAMWATPAINAPGVRRCPNQVPCRTVAVEGDVVVPVAVVSPKAEYAARTIRPKINQASGAVSGALPPLSAETRIGRYQNGRPGPGFHRRGLE
jgi:deoxyribodipyrimidine photo-lyase